MDKARRKEKNARRKKALVSVKNINKVKERFYQARAEAQRRGMSSVEKGYPKYLPSFQQLRTENLFINR